MQNIKEALGQIVVMQLLVTAVIVDRWASED